MQKQTLSSSNRFLCASKTSSLAEGRPGLAEDCGCSEAVEGEETDDDFSAASFSEAALITGLRGYGDEYLMKGFLSIQEFPYRGIEKPHSLNI